MLSSTNLCNRQSLSFTCGPCSTVLRGMGLPGFSQRRFVVPFYTFVVSIDARYRSSLNMSESSRKPAWQLVTGCTDSWSPVSPRKCLLAWAMGCTCSSQAWWFCRFLSSTFSYPKRNRYLWNVWTTFLLLVCLHDTLTRGSWKWFRARSMRTRGNVLHRRLLFWIRKKSSVLK